MYGILYQTNFCGQKDSSIPQCTKNRKKHAITINKGMLAQYFFTSEIGAQCHHFPFFYELQAQCASAHNLHTYTKSSDVSIKSNSTMDLNQQEK